MRGSNGAVLCLYEGLEMIPEAGLFTFSVDKAPYSNDGEHSVCLQANSQERPKDRFFFLLRIFFMRGAN